MGDDGSRPQRPADDRPGSMSTREARDAVDEAFALVGNETRLRILLELWRAQQPLGFSELRERVGMSDSGQFNYHLDKLVGRLVRRETGTDHQGEHDETGEGYELTYAGQQVVGSVYSGVFTREVTAGPVSTDGACFNCGRDLIAVYEDERAQITCSECEINILDFDIPPVAIEGRDPDRLPIVFDNWVRGRMELATSGFCWLCAGETGVELEPEPGPDGDHELRMATIECARCGSTSETVVGGMYLSHPEVVAFHLEHGIDLSTTPVWKLQWLFEPHTHVHEMDPPRFDVQIQLEDEELTCHIGEDFNVDGCTRSTR